MSTLQTSHTRSTVISRTPIRLVVVAIACFVSSLTVVSLRASPQLPVGEAAHFRGKLPELFKKMSAQRQVHIAFVGDPLWLDDSLRQGFVQTFLRKLEEAFFYSGGFHDLYEISHLEEQRAKITYECRPTDVADPGIFQMMQYVSTRGLLNEPDLLVLCAGPGDLESGLDLPTVLRGYEQLYTMAGESGAELLVLGPRAFVLGQEGGLKVQLETRSESVALANWAAEKSVAFHDPNPDLFPRGVLFHPNDDAQGIWDVFVKESADWIQGQQKRAEVAVRRQQAIGLGLYQSLIQEKGQARYKVESTVQGDKVTVRVSSEETPKLGGLIIPSSIAERNGVRFQPTDEQASFQLAVPNARLVTRGLWPLGLLVIDDRRLNWLDVEVPLASVGLEWMDHAHADNRENVPVRAKVFRYEGAPEQVPYKITFGDQSRSGTVRFAGDSTGLIDQIVTLPDTRTFRQSLVVELGANGSLGRYERQLDAIRQFPLKRAVPLQLVGADPAEAKQPADPLAVGGSEATLTLEASKEDLFIHIDLKNFELVSKGGATALQADLTLDARSYGKRQSLGYAGVLFMSAGPQDGPATVSPFAKQAHFGNGYARRPLVLGRQARLSTRPNGVRRLTIQMTRGYFYLHKWALDNHNSQLGIGLSLAITQAGDKPPLRYVLQETPRVPNNAEDLAIVELSEKGTNRWCVKWSP